MNSALVSIAITTYEANGDGLKLTRHNLDQIYQQSYDNIEIVISDHSVGDDIKNLCESYSSRDRYTIKYVKRSVNRGNTSDNINNAIEHCSGRYIKILFMDDYLYNRDAIATIVKSFVDNPDRLWLVHSYIHTKDRVNFYNLHHPRIHTNMIFCNRIGTPSCLTISRDVSERFDPNLKWFMDSEYYYRLLKNHGQPIILKTDEASQPFMINLHHENQVTNREINKKLIEDEKKYITAKLTEQI